MELIHEGYQNVFRLRSGKEFPASHDVIGLAPDLGIYLGSDAPLDEVVDLDDDELHELARYMIALWQLVAVGVLDAEEEEDDGS